MKFFDLDGVFVPDLAFHKASIDEEETMLYVRHNHMHPIFVPTGEYGIITGRPIIDKPHTMKWIDEFFDNKPAALYHENTNFNKASQYKVDVLTALYDMGIEVDTFVESNEVQSKYISKHCPFIKVVWFEEFIRESLSRV
jgi:hypothetical protein